MKKENKFLPEGYRYLKLGEKIEKNDYYWNNSTSQWIKIFYDSDTSNWVSEHVIRERKNETS